MGIAALICAMLLAALNRAREHSSYIPCLRHLNHIGSALLLYAHDNADQCPRELPVLIERGDLSADTLLCPDTRDSIAPGKTPLEQATALRTRAGHCSYVYLPTTRPASTLQSDLVLAYEPLSNHATGSFILYGDGHVDWVQAKSVQRILSELQSGHNPPR